MGVQALGGWSSDPSLASASTTNPMSSSPVNMAHSKDKPSPAEYRDAYIFLSFSVFAYGVMYAPARKYRRCDGVIFQFLMSIGVVSMGLCLQVVSVLLNWHDLFPGDSPGDSLTRTPSSTSSGVSIEEVLWNGVFLVFPAGLLGGFCWGISNVCVLISVKFLGLGVGFTLYHAVNLIVGYCVGRFHLFGVPREAPKTWIQDAAQLVNLMSFLLVMNVEAAPDAGSDVAASIQTEAVTNTDFSCFYSGNDGSRGNVSLDNGKSRKEGSDVGISENLCEAMLPPIEERDVTATSVISGSSLSVSNIPPSGGPLSGSSGTSTALARGSHEPTCDGGNGDAMTTSCSSISNVGARVDNSTNTKGGVRSVSAPPSTSTESEAGGKPRSVIPHSVSIGSNDVYGANPGKIAQKKLFGIVIGIFAGFSVSVNEVPYLVWTETATVPVELFVFSQTLGIFLISSLTFLTYYCLLRFLPADPRTEKVMWYFKKKQLQKVPPFWAAWIPGGLWAIGFYFSLDGVKILGMGIGYVLTAVGPVAVSGIISTICFDEIQGWRYKCMFWTAIGLQAFAQGMLIWGGDTNH